MSLTRIYLIYLFIIFIFGVFILRHSFSTDDDTIIISPIKFRKNSQNFYKNYNFNNNPKLPEHWKAILSLSNDLELILLDPSALKCILFHESTNEENRRKNCNELYSKNVVRFGTKIQNFEELIKRIEKVISMGNVFFDIQTRLPKNDPNTVILQFTSNLNFNKLFFISIIKTETKKNYHLFYGDNKNLETIAIRKFTLQNFTYSNLNKKNILFYPKELNRHLIYYENGKFRECNKELASRIPENVNRTIPFEATEILTNLIDKFMEIGQIPFMSFGTLLGWYRDCGYIPHTGDIDFYINANEYVDGFHKTFIDDLETPLLHEIGKQDYGHEFTFELNHGIEEFDKTKVDFFYLYENDLNTQWSPLLINFQKLYRAKCIIPKVEGLCTGDLYGYLFLLPCNFLPILKANYGPTWDILNQSIEYFGEGIQNFHDGFWNAKAEDIIIRNQRN